MPRRSINMSELRDRVCHNGKEFNDAMNDLLDQSCLDIDQVGRGEMLSLYSELVKTTPKDTHRAAVAFNINKEASEWVPPEGNYKGSLSGEVAKNVQNMDEIPPVNTITISNNIDYLPPLENGSSKQAPEGMIALALQKFTAKMRAAAEKFRLKRY